MTRKMGRSDGVKGRREVAVSEKKYDLATVRKAWGAGRGSKWPKGRKRETIWVVAFPDDACYAGKQLRRSKTEVEVELLDALMLAGCGLAGEGSLTGELRRFPVKLCKFFNDLQAMGTCVIEAIQRH